MFAERPVQVEMAAALSALKPLLESDAVLKVGQNIKYDINVFARNGIDVAPTDDTMVISFDLSAGRSEEGIGGGHALVDRRRCRVRHPPSRSQFSGS